MAQLIDNKHAVLLLPDLTKEATLFKPLYQVAKRNARYLTAPLLNPTLLEPLAHRNFPNLYTAAILWAKKTGTITNNYKMSTISGAQKDLIESLVTYGSRSTVLTPDQDGLTKLGWTAEEIEAIKEDYQITKKAKRSIID